MSSPLQIHHLQVKSKFIHCISYLLPVFSRPLPSTSSLTCYTHIYVCSLNSLLTSCYPCVASLFMYIKFSSTVIYFECEYKEGTREAKSNMLGGRWWCTIVTKLNQICRAERRSSCFSFSCYSTHTKGQHTL